MAYKILNVIFLNLTVLSAWALEYTDYNSAKGLDFLPQ